MTVTRKPKAKTAASEAQITALIDKGGSSTHDNTTQAPATRHMAVSLRIPVPLAQRLDAFLQDRLIRVPRQTWILEAIVEKLDREA